MGWLEDAVRKLKLTRSGNKNDESNGNQVSGSGGRSELTSTGTSRTKYSPSSSPGGSNSNTKTINRGKNNKNISSSSSNNNNKGMKYNNVARKCNSTDRTPRYQTMTKSRLPDQRAKTRHSRLNNNTVVNGNNGNNKKKLAPPVKAKRSTPNKVRPTLTTKKSHTVPSSKTGSSPLMPAKIPEAYRNADPTRWQLKKFSYNGGSSFLTCGKQEEVTGKSIVDATKLFTTNPGRYVALMYQTNIVTWPEKDHKYTLVHRDGTVGYTPQGVSPNGWMTIHMYEYRRLPPYQDNILPMKFRDQYTDTMTHKRRKLHGGNNKPIMPGRGMGIGDTPNLKLIGNVDPSDIHQGSVGDCWLLSAISALAEFDGAVKRLFRKTKNVDHRPFDGPNMYTVTLWDISTWKEVDIEIDERLPLAGDGSGRLLGSKPSEDGELWVCYLEKALAVHCGGWDNITGGQCTHAWALMTGCKEQYNIRKNPKTRKYECCAKYNPYERKWAKHYNAPHDGDGTMWRVPWPKVGGGGDKELTMEEVFLKMCAWDKVNYIVGAGTNGTTDYHTTDGMVDNHAYSVIECHRHVAGTNVDLIKVRNPWGKGEIEDGLFDDDGPGWEKYPQIKKKLNPKVADDGIFWVTKEEFFKYFQNIYLSASNMTEFVED